MSKKKISSGLDNYGGLGGNNWNYFFPNNPIHIPERNPVELEKIDKLDNDEYLYQVVEMIEADAGESPYWSFPDYWKDHAKGWAKTLSIKYFNLAEQHFKKTYNLEG